MAITAKTICLNTITDLGTIVSQDPTKLNLEPPKLIQALESPVNAVGIEQLKVQKLGKKNTVHVKYFPQDCGTVTEGFDSACVQGEDVPNEVEFKEVTGTKYLQTEHTFSKEEYREICEDWDGTITRKTLQLINRILLAERDFATAEMYANLANYFDGTLATPGGGTEKTLNLFTADGVPNALGMYLAQKEMELKGYESTNIMAVGGTSISAWTGAARNVFLGNVDGADTSRTSGINAYVDLAVGRYGAGVAGDANERALVWIPSHNQLIRYQMYEGKFVTNSDTLQERTITVNGRTYDYSIYMPDCGSVTIKVGTGVALFNAGQFSEVGCGAQASTLNFILNCGSLNCDTFKQPIANS
jgi:hypothetical protein